MRTYHLFTTRPNQWTGKDNQFIVVYEGRKCVEHWHISANKKSIHQARKDDIGITKRRFILSTTQHGQVTKTHDYKRITENEAYSMLI